MNDPVPPHVIENEVAAALWMQFGLENKKLHLRGEWSMLNATTKKRWKKTARSFIRMLKEQGVELR